MKDGLLFLDCDTNEYRVAKRNPKMPPFEICIFFSDLSHNLVNSDYNLRVYEFKVAACDMLTYTGQPLKTFEKTFLRDIPKSIFDKTKITLPDCFARRAEHFYTEYRRVRQGVTAWESGNIKLFGKLSFDSCEFSMNNYECGSTELIATYKIMSKLPGVFGGRLSVTGFKGSVIALVNSEFNDSIEKSITDQYFAQFPEYEGLFSVNWVTPDDGTRFITEIFSFTVSNFIYIYGHFYR